MREGVCVRCGADHARMNRNVLSKYCSKACMQRARCAAYAARRTPEARARRNAAKKQAYYDNDGLTAARRRLGINNPSSERREGSCPVCLRAAVLYCDHDHNTGIIRGWLCRKCNCGIGLMGDTLEGLQRAVAYLKDENDQA